MNELFWVYAIVISIVLLAMLEVRQKRYGWCLNFLVVVFAVYFGMFKLTGTPRDAWLFSTIEHVHGDMPVLYHMVVPHQYIYLLLRPENRGQPYYLRLPWSAAMENQIASAAMKAAEQRAPLMVDVDALSHWHVMAALHQTHGDQEGRNGQGKSRGRSVPGNNSGGKAMFYPKPIPADPLKTPVHTRIEVN